MIEIERYAVREQGHSVLTGAQGQVEPLGLRLAALRPAALR